MPRHCRLAQRTIWNLLALWLAPAVAPAADSGPGPADHRTGQHGPGRPPGHGAVDCDRLLRQGWRGARPDA